MTQKTKNIPTVLIGELATPSDTLNVRGTKKLFIVLTVETKFRVVVALAMVLPRVRLLSLFPTPI